MNMRDISKKIGLIADEIFDVEMENFENKFYQDLNHKGLEGFDTVVVYEEHYCLFYNQLRDFWEAKKSTFQEDPGVAHGMTNLNEFRSYIAKRFHQIRELRYEELLREVLESYGTRTKEK